MFVTTRYLLLWCDILCQPSQLLRNSEIQPSATFPVIFIFFLNMGCIIDKDFSLKQTEMFRVQPKRNIVVVFHKWTTPGSREVGRQRNLTDLLQMTWLTLLIFWIRSCLESM